MPIWASVLATFVLGERLDRRRGAALVLGIAGLIILFWPLLEDGVPVGAVYALGSAVSWAAGTVYLKWAQIDAHPLAIAAWQLVVGTIAVAAGFCLTGFEIGDIRHWSSLAGLCYSTIIGTALAYLLWFQSVARLPASVAGLGTLLVPVIGVVDSNHSPVGIDYVIPGNDDSSKAVALYAKAVADAVLEGKANAVNDVVAAVAGGDEFVEVSEEA